MILSVNDIQFSYGTKDVLSGTNFDISPGKFTTLLGVNGAGKTTLLKCCNRILEPKAGAVFVDGENLAFLPRRKIATTLGYVPQKGSDVDMSVFEMVLLGRHPHSFWGPTVNDESVVHDILLLLGLEQFAHRPFYTLSGGEAQKVLIGRALAQDPKILLLDEPTSSLDLKNQLNIMNLLNHLAHEHDLAVLASIHDINLALRHSDQTIMLKNGEIHWAGKPEEVTGELIDTVYGINPVMTTIDNRPVFII